MALGKNHRQHAEPSQQGGHSHGAQAGGLALEGSVTGSEALILKLVEATVADYAYPGEAERQGYF